jgi:hypothetical protein
MKLSIFLKNAAISLALAVTSSAAQPTNHVEMHTMSSTPDNREILDFPPPMREHMLRNMRSHFEAINEIILALSVSNGAEAAKIARTKLSLESVNAAACDPKQATKGGAMNDMAQMMARHMPEEVRALGYAMHESAGQFALEAEKLKTNGDPRPSLAALAKTTEHCATCHAAYRLK